MVINAMARLFMDPLDDPFAAVEQTLSAVTMPAEADAIVLDFHGEATSEKMSMGHFLDGRATLVVGTHSHVPTADAQILPGGTAFQTDAGMCGDYDSVIGMKKSAAMARFVTKMPGERLTPAESAATLCGVVVDTDDATGLASRVAPLRLGGRLKPEWPDFGAAGADAAAGRFADKTTAFRQRKVGLNRAVEDRRVDSGVDVLGQSQRRGAVDGLEFERPRVGHSKDMNATTSMRDR